MHILCVINTVIDRAHLCLHALSILQAFAESIGFSGGYAIERSTTACLLSAYTRQVGSTSCGPL